MTTNTAPAWFTTATAALRAGDIDTFVDIYAEDGVHEFPFAPEGRPTRLEGRAAIAEYMQQLPKLVEYDSFEIETVREVGDDLIVEAEAHGKRPATGAPFHMQYVWIITREDGRVTRFRDYMNPLLNA